MQLNEQLELKLLIEAGEQTPIGAKRVAIVIGRFNPPTRGHYAVISEVTKFIRANPKLDLEPYPVVVVVGGSKSDSDKKRNPLSVDDRILFMSSSGHANGVKFISAKNAFEAFANARKEGFEPIAIAAGSDRIQDYVKILDKHFTDNGEPIKHYSINLTRDEDAVETNKDDKQKAMDATLDSLKSKNILPVDQISGSLARRAVELGYQEEFAKIVGLDKKPALASRMFAKIAAAIKE
jgi:hypothetical protein